MAHQVTNDQQLYCQSNNHAPDGCGVITLVDAVGFSQRDHANEYVAILSTGAVLKFAGNYVVSDQPQKIVQQPKLSINENAAISNTDVSKTQGGKRPPRK